MTASRVRIEVPRERIAEFCRRHHIRRLAFFGSVLRDDFTPDSDVDVLVEFPPGSTPEKRRTGCLAKGQAAGDRCASRGILI